MAIISDEIMGPSVGPSLLGDIASLYEMNPFVGIIASLSEANSL